jgi:hypothetical protein
MNNNNNNNNNDAGTAEHPIVVADSNKIDWSAAGARLYCYYSADPARIYCVLCNHETFLKNKVAPENGKGNWKKDGKNTTNIRSHFLSHHSSVPIADLEKWKKIAAEHNKSPFTPLLVDVMNKTVKRTWYLTDKLYIVLTDEEYFLFHLVTCNASFFTVSKETFRFSYPAQIPRGCLDRNNIPTKLRLFANRLRQHLLPSLAGKNVTLIADKGRIWYDYIPFCVVNTEDGTMVLWDMVQVSKTSIFKNNPALNNNKKNNNNINSIENAKALVIAEEAKRINAELKVATINLIAVCTDNASNMTKFVSIMKEELGIIGLGCMCHGIALMLKDAVDQIPLWKEYVERACLLRVTFNTKFASGSDRPFREANDTRWNSKARLLRDVVKHYPRVSKDFAVGVEMMFTTEDLKFCETLCKQLEGVETATKICESDKSTLLDAIPALQLLMEVEPHSVNRLDGIGAHLFEDALIKRCENLMLLCEPLIALIFFFPTFNRDSLKKPRNNNNNNNATVQQQLADQNGADFIDLKQFVLQILTGEKMLKLAGLSLADKADVEKEMLEFLHRDPQRVYKTMDYSVKRYVEYFEKVMCKYPKIQKILLLFSQVLINEAGCERIFSIFGHAVNRRRMRMNPATCFNLLQTLLMINNKEIQSKTSKKKLINDLAVKLGGVDNNNNNNSAADEIGLGGEQNGDEDLIEEEEEDEEEEKDEHEEQERHNTSRDMVIKPEFCYFVAQRALAIYRKRADTTRHCAVCLMKSKTQQVAAQCCRKDGGEFQCHRCNHWFGVACYNEEYTETFTEYISDVDCAFCNLGMKIELPSGTRRERNN